MTSLYVHPRLGEVTLSQTVRARRISISVRATGAVRLAAKTGFGFSGAKSGMDRGGARTARPQAGIPASAVAARGAESPHRGAAPCGESRPAGPHRATVGGDGPEVRKTFDPRLAHEVGELLGAQPHLVEPLSDDSSGAPARLCDRPRTLPHGSPRPFAPFPCLGRPSGRRA